MKSPPLQFRLAVQASEHPFTPDSAQFTLNAAEMAAIKSVQKHIQSKGRAGMTMRLEIEVDSWLPRGIDSQLRFTDVELIVTATACWFSAYSSLLGVSFQTMPQEISYLESQLAGLSIPAKMVDLATA